MESVADEEGNGPDETDSGVVPEALPGGRARRPERVCGVVPTACRSIPAVQPGHRGRAGRAATGLGWADGAYDVVTLALTAIDLVVSRQGFEEEATRGDVVSALTGLAALAAPDRTSEASRPGVAAMAVGVAGTPRSSRSSRAPRKSSGCSSGVRSPGWTFGSLTCAYTYYLLGILTASRPAHVA
jgi:hypothetical protein